MNRFHSRAVSFTATGRLGLTFFYFTFLVQERPTLDIGVSINSGGLEPTQPPWLNQKIIELPI